MANQVSFEKGKSYKLKGARSIMSKQGQWLPPGSDINVLRNNDDQTLLVKLPDGSLATCADFMLETEQKAQGFADFDTRVVGNKEETLPIPPGREVMVGGKKFVERDVPLLFETGDYPDKEFSMTPEEGQQVYEDFLKNVKEVPVPVSHKATVLDGHNGSKLNHIEYKIIERDGKRVGQFVNGKVLLESYLDPFLSKEKTWGLSARFENKEGKLKRLVHAALVPNPRIESARIAAGASFEKALADFAEKEMMGGTTVPGNANGTTVPTDKDLPPIPEGAENGTAPVLPKESPTGEELATTENGGKGDANDDEAALEELGNYEDEPEEEDGDEEGDPDAALHGNALWDRIMELVGRAQKETQGDTTRSAEYIEQLQKLMEMVGGNKGEQAPPAAAPVAEEMPPAKPAAEFAKEAKATIEAQDKKMAKMEADFAVESKRIAPHEWDAIYGGLVKAARADRALGVADFDHTDSLFGEQVKQLKARKPDPQGIFKQSGADFSLINTGKPTGNASKEEKEKEMQQLEKLDPQLARAREFNRKQAAKN